MGASIHGEITLLFVIPCFPLFFTCSRLEDFAGPPAGVSQCILPQGDCWLYKTRKRKNAFFVGVQGITFFPFSLYFLKREVVVL